jgi:deazaflavin-dependent oxidoreductase (nitroreductase family)
MGSMAIDLKDCLFKVANAAHPALLRLSGGRIGGRIVGMPVVVLTTTGRKTGKPRTVPLTALEHDGHTYVIASKGGDDHHPTWYLNLVATPEVSVQRGGRTEPMVARTLSFEEKAEVWPLVTRAYKGYASYQKRTDREIPVVELVPQPG